MWTGSLMIWLNLMNRTHEYSNYLGKSKTKMKIHLLHLISSCILWFLHLGLWECNWTFFSSYTYKWRSRRWEEWNQEYFDSKTSKIICLKEKKKNNNKPGRLTEKSLEKIAVQKIDKVRSQAWKKKRKLNSQWGKKRL